MRTPSLRIHRTGQYSTAWAGKTFYFGKDKKEAEKRYHENLKDWLAWKGERCVQGSVAVRVPVKCVEIATAFLDAKESEGGNDLRCYYRKHLRRFLNVFGPAVAAKVRPLQMQSFKQELIKLGLADKTVNHDIVAVKAMFHWASGIEMIPPVDLRAVRQIPLGPPPVKGLSETAVIEFLTRAPDHIRPWLVVNYLTLARPSEVVRVVGRHGTWVEEGIFQVPSKNDKRTKQPRHLVFSETALSWLHSCEPRWTRLDSYSQAVRDACGEGGPHPLRHSAATHLLRRGATRADVDLLLGHYPSRVTLTYAPIIWQPLRAIAAQLVL